jgi:hypothetical protein
MAALWTLKVSAIFLADRTEIIQQALGFMATAMEKQTAHQELACSIWTNRSIAARVTRSCGSFNTVVELESATRVAQLCQDFGDSRYELGPQDRKSSPSFASWFYPSPFANLGLSHREDQSGFLAR